MNKTRKTTLLLLATAALVAGGWLGAALFSSAYSADKTAYIYLDKDDTPDSLYCKLDSIGCSTQAITLLSKVKSFRVRTGRYAIQPGTSGISLFRQLRNGMQAPIMLQVPSVRTMDRMAGAMARHLMVDSVEVLRALTDTARIEALGFTPTTFPSLFIPNSYEVFWDISVDKLIRRLVEEHKRFWNEERMQKAASLGLSPCEVYTLASIVDEETANNAEKPTVAGLYLNRLKAGMPLQADPTVKKAVGDWSLRRILHVHLAVESPYNTYLHTGLPPGPIRISSIAGIDAVLNRSQHDYLYMCAKEDFSGTHNFATTYAEHLVNAKRYTNALNQRGIR